MAGRDGVGAESLLEYGRRRDDSTPPHPEATATEGLRNPNNWQLESTNYTLIMAIYSQLSETNRGLFLGGSLNVWTRKHIPSRVETQHLWPSWNGHTSALPLLAEFCVRNGRLNLLLDVLKNVGCLRPVLLSCLRSSRDGALRKSFTLT
jgi:hypothetical protein